MYCASRPLTSGAGGALRDWRSSANALETAPEDCGDALLTLDEVHQANPADVPAACYMLADGGGKNRLKPDASPARRRSWRTFILSTGEPTRRRRGPMGKRLIDKVLRSIQDDPVRRACAQPSACRGDPAQPHSDVT